MILSVWLSSTVTVRALVKSKPLSKRVIFGHVLMIPTLPHWKVSQRLMMFPGLLYLAAIGAVHINWKKIILPFAAVFLFSIWKTYSFVGSDKAEGTALIAQAHFAKGNYEHAEELLLFSAKRFRDSSRIENMLGNIAEKKGDLPLARQYYSKVTQTEPFMPEGWMNLANITQEPEKAEKYFRRALQC